MDRIARTLAPILLQMLCAAGAIAGGVVTAMFADHQIHATGAAHTAWLAVFACLGMAASGDLLGRLTARTEVCPDCVDCAPAVDVRPTSD